VTPMKMLTRPRQIFLYVAPFLGLAFFKVWAGRGIDSPERLLAAAAAVLAYCVVVTLLAFRWDRPSYFDWVITAYFAVVTSFLLLSPETAGKLLARYSVTGIYICLFAAAFFPPLFGMEPFTYHYAKKYAPEEVWDNPIFVRVNRIMTQVWQALFAVCMVVSLYPSVVTRALIPLSLLLGIGLPFNLRFPDYYLKRLGLPSLANQRRQAADGKLFHDTSSPQGPLPATAREAIFNMTEAFNAGAAENLSAVIGFVVTGAENFETTLTIHNGSCNLEEKRPHKPDLLIRTPAQVWLDIARGELSGKKAFGEGAYKAEGNLGILMRMGEIFSGRGTTLHTSSGAAQADHAVSFPESTDKTTGQTPLTSK
jgi:putative sterol carrier protein